MAVSTLFVPGWRPATLNAMIGRHHGVVARLKRLDRETVGTYALAAGLPRAAGPRRVDLLITLAGRQKAADRDAYWKSLLDALVHAGLLVDDGPAHCVPGSVEYARVFTPAQAGTRITLTDLEAC